MNVELIKVLIIGDATVGKTSILNKYVNKYFGMNYEATIGIDLLVNKEMYDERIFKLQIWDTAGQERFDSIVSTYYKGSKVVLLCFDITNLDTFAHLDRWMNKIYTHIVNEVLIILIGTKCDISHQRRVDIRNIEDFVEKYGISEYIEVSSKSGENVNKIFDLVCKYYSEKNEPPKFITDEIKIDKYSPKSERMCCYYF